MNKYIHLIDGRPAYYLPGQQVYFAGHGVKIHQFLVDDLPTIRKQQMLSRRFRRDRGFEHHMEYGYLRIKVI